MVGRKENPQGVVRQLCQLPGPHWHTGKCRLQQGPCVWPCCGCVAATWTNFTARRSLAPCPGPAAAGSLFPLSTNVCLPNPFTTHTYVGLLFHNPQVDLGLASRVRAVACGGMHSLALLEDGTVRGKGGVVGWGVCNVTSHVGEEFFVAAAACGGPQSLPFLEHGKLG